MSEDEKKRLGSSFRDKSGFMFLKDGSLYRQINLCYKDNYDYLMQSGLYDTLVKEKLLIPHCEKENPLEGEERLYKIIQPDTVKFISYPYEWCFSQLKDAALTTLKIQKIALQFGMVLKDASAYNIQFKDGRPILIDTLSFERFHKGSPWIAYRQFCQHFLAPLALMVYKDARLNQLSRIYLDGIPLDLASSLLPLRTHFYFSLFFHIHLHSAFQRYFSNRFFIKPAKNYRKEIKNFDLLALIENLEGLIRRMQWRYPKIGWINYDKATNYSPRAFQHKKRILEKFLERINPKCVWDLGSNKAIFSRVASNRGIHTIAFDIDPAVVEENYLECVKEKESNLLPLVLDLTNPSAAIGWANEERLSLLERGPADVALALALIHHLAIANNLPFERIADFFHKICRVLIIEFVPKTDTQVQRMLATRTDTFPDYTQENFEQSFKKSFVIEESVNIDDSQRTLYLLRIK